MSYGNAYSRIKGLCDYFETNLPTHIGYVEAEIGVTIPDPADYVLGYRDVLSSERYPLFCCSSDSAIVEDSGQHGIWLTIKVDLVVGFKHSQPAVLEAQLMGCGDAILNLVESDESLGGLVNEAAVEMLDWYHGAPGSKDLGVVVATVSMLSEIRT